MNHSHLHETEVVTEQDLGCYWEKQETEMK